jgi:hypothetical protein
MTPHPGIHPRRAAPTHSRPAIVAIAVLIAAGGVFASPATASGPAFAGDPAAAVPARIASPLSSICAMNPGSPWRPKEFGLLYAKGLFHVFYMRHNYYVGDPDSTELDFGHAVSTDLVSWTQLPPVLPARPGYWDSHHVWSPQVIEQNGVYYLFYTGVQDVPFVWGWMQRLGVATSTDLMNWTRYDHPVFTGNMASWVYADSSQFDGCQFRDGFLMPDPTQPGKWLMYYVAVPKVARGQLIVGIARSGSSLLEWHDVGPMWCTDNAHFWGWCESPMLMQHAGLWYLFANTVSGHPTSFRTAPSPLADSTQWSGKYRLFDMAGQDTTSDQWFGTEYLSLGGHDLLGYVNNHTLALEFQEIVWGNPPNFTLQRPNLLAVGDGAPPAHVRLSLLGRASLGAGAVLRLALPAAAKVRLDVLDVTGRRVCVLDAGERAAGESLLEWDGRDRAGAPVARGIYFARVATAAGSAVARIAVTD